MSTAASVRLADSVWKGRPVYRCRVCGPRYERVSSLSAVLEHEAEAHPQPEKSAPVVRESRILGPDGMPLKVMEE